jgi:hypothetical protein
VSDFHDCRDKGSLQVRERTGSFTTLGGGATAVTKPASPQSGAQNIASVGSRNVRNPDVLSSSPQDNKLGKHQEQHHMQNAPSREGIRDKIRRKGLKKVMAAVGGTP